jgi:hypothetical protein
LKIKQDILKSLLTTCLLILVSNLIVSQNLNINNKNQENILIARIKQLDDFINRFNMMSDFSGNPADSLFKSKVTRLKMISSLFDLKDPRILDLKKVSSREYLKIKELFINEVIEKNILLSKISPGIIAEARSKFTYNKKQLIVSLFLNQESLKAGELKWVLIYAKSNELNKLFTDTISDRFIPPNSNEVDFIDLRNAFKDADHIQDYTSNIFEPDLLSVIIFCLKEQIIKFEYVEEVIYHIIDIPGWYIKIEDFNRNELNSGWLITDVKKFESSIPDFLKSL